MKLNSILILALLFTALFTGTAVAQEAMPEPELISETIGSHPVEVVVVHGKGCPHCASLLDFLEDIKPSYPELTVVEYEIYFDKDNLKIAQKLAESYGKDIGGVPAIFIADTMMVGFNNAIGETLETNIQKCIAEGCESPLSRLESPGEEIDVVHIETDSSPGENPEKKDLLDKVTIPAIISAALVDAINPCAFAVLIILLTTILATKSKRRALLAGLAFTLSIFIAYFLMGLGLFSAIRAAGLTSMFYAIVAVLAILVGLFNLKDYLWYGKWFKMEVPEKWRPKMKSLLKGITSVPGAFLIGFVISLFLLPCTSGPYIVILGLLAESATRMNAMCYLILYNFIFVIPMLIITFAIAFGFTTTEKAEQFRTRKLRVLHLIAGVIILIIGLFMIAAMLLGYV